LTQEQPARNAGTHGSAPAAEWSIRPFREEDVPGIASLINAVFDAYRLQEGVTEDDLRNDLFVPDSDPERQVLVVDGPRVNGVPDDMPVAYARVVSRDDPEAGDRIYYMRVTVHPAAEGMGLEQDLAARLIEIAREYEAEPGTAPRATVRVKSYTPDRMNHTRALLAGLGMREVRQFWVMERDLTEPIDEPAPIEGVTIRPYSRPEDNVGARTAFEDSFSDHWDHHPTTQEEWDHRAGSEGMRPDLSLLAEIDGEPGTFGAFCIISVSDKDNRRRGVREGWIDLLGTTRAWRRVGLGKAILLHGLHCLKSAGMDTALLGVDSESLTGANRLYESAGFRIRSREFSYEAPLSEIGSRREDASAA
jgi:mycothiol synthase